MVPGCGLDSDVPRTGMSSNDSDLLLRAVALGHGIALEHRSLCRMPFGRGNRYR